MGVQRLAVAILVLAASTASAQNRTIRTELTDTVHLHHGALQVRVVNYRGRQALHVLNPPVGALGAAILIPGTEMANGTVELDVAGQPIAGAAPDARGFIGLVFRAVDDTTYDSFYIRPTNGRAEDQIRRNHSAQYIAAPDFLFDRLRAEAPGAYESYVDLETGAWTHLRVEVSGSTARLFVNSSSQPVLIANPLKGHGVSGLVGLWIGDQTDAYFSRLQVTVSQSGDSRR